MKKSIRAAAAAMLIPILLTLTGCSLTVDGVMSVIAPTETPVPGSDLVFSDAPEVTPEPRQIAYEKMDGVFSPFFAETDGDKAVAEMTQLSLRAVEGNRAPAEITRTTGTDGTVSVTIRLEKGLLCADGVELTADDLLFTYYVLMDESYDGPYTINQLPIDGIALYWNGMDSGMYGKYMMIYDEIYNGGKYESDLEKAVEDAKRAAMEKGVSEANVESDADVVKAQQALDEYDTVRADEIRDAIDNAWRNDAQVLVDTRSKTTAAPSRFARRTPARKCSAIPVCRWRIRCSTAASASLTITAGLPRTAERHGILRQRSRRRRISITKCTMLTTAMWRSTGASRASAARICSLRCRILSCANGRRWTMTGAAACRACPA